MPTGPTRLNFFFSSLHENMCAGEAKSEEGTWKPGSVGLSYGRSHEGCSLGSFCCESNGRSMIGWINCGIVIPCNGTIV